MDEEAESDIFQENEQEEKRDLRMGSFLRRQ